MSPRPGRKPTPLTAVLLKRIATLETELAIRNAENEAAHALHREEVATLTRQCDTLTHEAMVRQVAQQRAERRLIEGAA